MSEVLSFGCSVVHLAHVHPLNIPNSPSVFSLRRLAGPASSKRNGWFAAVSVALAASIALIAFGARAADEKPGADAPPATKITIHYLAKEYEEPPPLSLVRQYPH